MLTKLLPNDALSVLLSYTSILDAPPVGCKEEVRLDEDGNGDTLRLSKWFLNSGLITP